MIFVYVIGWIFITITVIAITFGLFCWFSKRFFFHNKLEDIKINKPNLWIGLLLVLAILLIFFAFIAPVLLTNSKDYSHFGEKTAHVGDTIGGIMNPFIALSAVIVTGLAFYMQYQANKQVQDQFKLQQFESQLFKMIDNYNYTINHFMMKSRESDEIFEGKDFFFSLHQEFKSAYSDIEAFSNMFFKKYGHKDSYTNIIEENYLNIIKKITNNIDKIIQLEITYLVFFFGVSHGGRESITKLLEDKYDAKFILELTNCLSYKLQGFQKNDDGKSYWADKKFQIQLTDWTKPNESNKVKYHNGHQSKLGHYYRQNYMIIKFIDDFKDEKIDYNKRWEYSKLLRSLYSNHEQIMFYLNSVSILGRNWELDHKKDSNKKWITKYDLIRNIPKSYRVKYFINDFYANVDYEFEDESEERKKLNQNIYK